MKKMKLIEHLKTMSTTLYKDEDGEAFHILLKKGMTTTEIDLLKKQIPNKNLSKELEEMLKYSRGFDIPFGFLEEVKFIDFGGVGLERLFQFSLNITDDSTGNYWIQAINPKGKWGDLLCLS